MKQFKKIFVLIFTIIITTTGINSASCISSHIASPSVVYASKKQHVKHRKVIKKKRTKSKVIVNHQLPKPNTYVINKVTPQVMETYFIKNLHWHTNELTYDDSELSVSDQRIVDSMYRLVTKSNIVTLHKVNGQADIDIVPIYNTPDTIYLLGITHMTYQHDEDSFGCHPIVKANIKLYMDKIHGNSYGKYQLLLRSIALHELGHALGLDHNPLEHTIMNASSNGNTVVTKDKKFPVVDQSFVDALAILYSARSDY